jgi:hypothetical protein
MGGLSVLWLVSPVASYRLAGREECIADIALDDSWNIIVRKNRVRWNGKPGQP